MDEFLNLIGILGKFWEFYGRKKKSLLIFNLRLVFENEIR